VKLLQTKLFPIIIICCLGVLAYSNTFYSSFHFDDFPGIVNNLAIRNLFNLGNIWNFFPARFITYLSFALNYQIHQLNVVGYHIVNLAVHIITAILLFWLVNLTLLTPVMREEKITQAPKLISLFIALVFLIHPIQTQGVTYIFQRVASMATLFYLASLGLYAKSRLLLDQELTKGLARRYYFSSLAVAVITMFTKEIAITLPLIICLYEFSFFKTTKSFKYKQLIPFLVTLVIIPLTMLVTKSTNFTTMWRDNQETLVIPPWHYLLTKFMVLATYIRLAFLPFNQNLDYDLPIVQTLFGLPILFGLFFLILSIVIAFRLFRSYRLISFGILFFFLTLSFEWSIIPIPEVFYEHRLYLSMAGFSIFLVTSLYYLLSNKHPKAMLTILITLVAVYSALTYTRNNVWKDDLTLWNDTIRKSPYKARPYHNRGLAYQNQGNLDQALLDFNKAIAINPKEADFYNNRGTVYQDLGNFDQAILDLNKAIEINPNDSGFYNNRGLTYYRHQGNFEKAILDFNKALEVNPNDANAYDNRGIAYHYQGKLDQALLDFNKSIEINPGYVDAYNNRGNVYQDQGKLDQAILDYNKAMQINPNYAMAYNNRGVIYYFLREYDKAWVDVHKAQRLGCAVNPEFIAALKKASGRDK
jgi:protein O-mannosyl-transferase